MSSPTNQPRNVPALVRVFVVLFLLYGFLIAIRLMGSSISALGKATAGGLFEGIENPFAGLAVGLLATVLVQSSSTTTATIVGLVGQAGPAALPLRTAVPMIMGANIGTTVTNTIVSIGHVRQGHEFRRAFAAATVHDFFNLMCVALLLPVELATGFLRKTAIFLTERLAGTSSGGKLESPIKDAVKAGAKVVQSGVDSLGLTGTPAALVLLLLGIGLTFCCLVLVTRNMRVLISGPLERALNSTLDRAGVLGMLVGAGVTIAVQSSSITTSLLVPLCAAGVLTLRNAFPIMLGANIGTTVTGVMASMATETSAGLTIALVHVMFNLLGVVLFYPIPFFRNLPIAAAEALAARAQRNVMYLVLYVVGVFVALPVVGYLVFQGLSS